jgi:hypothetical protein
MAEHFNVRHHVTEFTGQYGVKRHQGDGTVCQGISGWRTRRQYAREELTMLPYQQA